MNRSSSPSLSLPFRRPGGGSAVERAPFPGTKLAPHREREIIKDARLSMLVDWQVFSGAPVDTLVPVGPFQECTSLSRCAEEIWDHLGSW